MEKNDLIVEYDGQGDLTVKKLSVLTITPERKDVLASVVFLRDGDWHSIRLSRGPLGISAMDTAIPGSFGSIVARNDIERTVQMIQRVYLVFALLGILALLDVLSGLRGPVIANDAVWRVFVVLIDATIYFGLRYRVQGVLSFVLIFSAFQCIVCFVYLMTPATNIGALAAKVVWLVLLLFFAYQIWFFRRRDVRAHFKDAGVLVF